MILLEFIGNNILLFISLEVIATTWYIIYVSEATKSKEIV